MDTEKLSFNAGELRDARNKLVSDIEGTINEFTRKTGLRVQSITKTPPGSMAGPEYFSGEKIIIRILFE